MDQLKRVLKVLGAAFGSLCTKRAKSLGYVTTFVKAPAAAKAAAVETADEEHVEREDL